MNTYTKYKQRQKELSDMLKDTCAILEITEVKEVKQIADDLMRDLTEPKDKVILLDIVVHRIDYGAFP